MDALLVDGDEIELTPDPPWMWMAPVRLSVMAMPGHKIKADGKFTIWDTEIMQAGLLAAGKMYTAPALQHRAASSHAPLSSSRRR